MVSVAFFQVKIDRFPIKAISSFYWSRQTFRPHFLYFRGQLFHFLKLELFNQDQANIFRSRWNFFRDKNNGNHNLLKIS